MAASRVKALASLVRDFGRRAARQKARLLAAIVRGGQPATRQLLALQDAASMLLAYPDDQQVRQLASRLVRRLRQWSEALTETERDELWNTGFPGALNVHAFSFAVARRLDRLFPDCLEVDLDQGADEPLLQGLLGLAVAAVERQALDDVDLPMAEWLARAKPSGQSTLRFLLDSIGSAFAEPLHAEAVFDALGLFTRYRLTRPGSGRCEIVGPTNAIAYQRQPIEPETRPLGSIVAEPFTRLVRLATRDGRAIADLALRALAARDLEIFALSHANERDVWLADCGRGLEIALLGVEPLCRDPLESHYGLFVVKNGVPIGYGPASVCFGCCELGLNLWPEFRGAEVRYLYPQILRAIHQVLGARFFYLTPYGMGVGNPDAIATGAFWFYRKLGFSVRNPRVETLARAEEAKMRADPAYRCDRRTLHRLSRTEAFFDLSAGRCRRLDLVPLGLLASRLLGARGDRRRGLDRCCDRAARALDLGLWRAWSPVRQHGLELLAPLVCLVGGVGRWPVADRRLLARLVGAKGSPSEAEADRLLQRQPRLEAGLRRLVDRASVAALHRGG